MKQFKEKIDTYFLFFPVTNNFDDGMFCAMDCTLTSLCFNNCFEQPYLIHSIIIFLHVIYR